MKLILTSTFATSASAVVKHLPKPSKTKIAFIPTAANNYVDKYFVANDRNIFLQLGFQVSDVDIAQVQHSELENSLKEADIIYVAGGNTYYLLDQVRKSGFDKIIKDRLEAGVIYMGGSAGSLLACPTIDIARGLDDPGQAPDLTDYTGLKLVDYIILPHYGNPKYIKKMDAILDEWKDREYEIKPLQDNQAFLIENGKETLLTAK